MSKKCPICGGEEFLVTAHVTQGWKVDGNGNFLKCVTECEETTHTPDNDDIWGCALCGYSDTGSVFEPGSPGFEDAKIIKGRKTLMRTLCVEPTLYAKITRYLAASKPEEYQGEDETIILTAKFSDGHEIDVKCCGCQDESSYTEAVLFDANGCELKSEPGEDFLGEWTLSHGDVDYTVKVILAPYITEDILTRAYKQGIVKLVASVKNGVVAQIGDNWFYFGGETAEEYDNPEQYKTDMEESEILQNIMDVLEGFRRSGSEEFSDEYAYYACYIQENLDKT